MRGIVWSNIFRLFAVGTPRAEFSWKGVPGHRWFLKASSTGGILAGVAGVCFAFFSVLVAFMVSLGTLSQWDLILYLEGVKPK